MAIGMDKLAGPVSPGDIIMRNEEAPRGAAALLNKMINKGTRGMYKLPEAEKEMPGFMKDAMENMEEVKLDASDFRTILKLLQQGFSMEEIENMTQASMLQDKAKTLNEAAPEGEMLAYINPQEAGVLKLLGGSGKMTPAGIPSFDKEEDEMMGFSSPTTSAYTSTPKQDDFGGAREGYIAGSNVIVGSENPFTPGSSEAAGFDAGQQEKDRTQRAKTGDLTTEEQSQAMAIADKTGKDPYNIFDDFAKDVITSPDPYKTLQQNKYGQQVIDLIEDFEPLTGNIGLEDFNLLGMAKTIADQLGKDEEERMYRDEDKTELTREGFMKKLGDIPGGRDTFFNLIKRFDPENFYKVVGMPQTSGGLEDMSKLQMLSTDGIDRTTPEGKKRYNEIKRFNAQIMEARDKTQSKGDRPQQGGGRPAMAEKPAEEEAQKDQSEYAGMFDVPGTMMFEGKEVPVGRRFSTNIEDVMKRALEGTSERQLEPFAQYVKRRRDFLGEDEDEFFDEEGNVIYGGVA